MELGNLQLLFYFFNFHESIILIYLENLLLYIKNIPGYNDKYGLGIFRRLLSKINPGELEWKESKMKRVKKTNILVKVLKHCIISFHLYNTQEKGQIYSSVVISMYLGAGHDVVLPQNGA